MHFNDLQYATPGHLLFFNAKYNAIQHLLIDSRKNVPVHGCLFFAISGDRNNGHDYIGQVYERGVRQFVVEQPDAVSPYQDVNVYQVDNTITALQDLAKFHRNKFGLEVVGVTGSNGKTIVKEWLVSMLTPHFYVVNSPGSYNSQVGVPLSVWQISSAHQLGVFEAGISRTGEMERLQEMINPTIGIFTNLGSAHDGSFSSREEKLQEKFKLFKNCTCIVHKYDEQFNGLSSDKKFTWGETQDAEVVIAKRETYTTISRLQLLYKGNQYHLQLPFTDDASFENAMHVISYMLYKGFREDHIQTGLNEIRPVKMRLELKAGINDNQIIDDSYNNDLGGLQTALNFLKLQSARKDKVIILSDLLQTGIADKELYQKVAELINAAEINKLITIGASSAQLKNYFNNTIHYSDSKALIENFDFNQLKNAIILVKGARTFSLEKVVQRLEQQIHGTHLEINLDALTNNLNFYRSKLKGHTKLMVMVKAFAYGSGSEQIAKLLQYHRVDYLGVAYSDEGVYLRNKGILTPIMVMNTTRDNFPSLIRYELEPEIYNITILKEFISFLDGKQASIHLKLETGMNRLGFDLNDLGELVDLLKKNKNLYVKSVFSHLAAADDASEETYTIEQGRKFNNMSEIVFENLNYRPLKHILNSAGIIRYPHMQFDMVRLGIGLYGVEANDLGQQNLQPISTLKTLVSQVNHIKKGETVGYGRKGIAINNMQVATIAIGYADGFTRAFSNGVGKVWINGRRAPVFGNVCMDMTMVDVSGLEVQVGDEVEIFGTHISLMEMASWINTIPYEILTNVSQRVKRIYYSE